MHMPRETRAILSFILMWLVTATGSAWVGVQHPWFLLDENQILYIFSTAAQVVAGIFALTITGFLFLRSELDRQREDDETVAEAIDRIKQQYFNLTLFVCVASTSTIILCLLTLGIEGTASPLVSGGLINLTSTLLLITLLSIVYFIMDIINPGVIQEVSETIRRELEGNAITPEPGGLSAFLHCLKQIERLLTRYRAEHIGHPHDGRNAPLGMRRVVELLHANNVIDADTCEQLVRLFRLRNAWLHGSTPTVSPKTVGQAQRCHALLEAALRPRHPGA